MISWKQSNSGYSINLETKKVCYLAFDGTLTCVATFESIEHANGHKKTQDQLTGNNQNNVLNGSAGKDKIWGKSGDNILILTEGEAHGGLGVDNYIILENQSSDPAQVNIHDIKGDISLITLPSEIFSFYLLKNQEKMDQYDIQIIVDSSNEEISRTTIFIKNVYYSKNTDTLALNGRYLFSTAGRLLLFPDWPETITKDKRGNFFLLTDLKRSIV